MPVVRKLSAEEVQALTNTTKQPTQRQQVEQLYDGFLHDLELGEYAILDLDEGENRITVANRLRAAAKRRNVSLHFLRTTGNSMRFQVMAAEAAQTATAYIENEALPVASEPMIKRGKRRKAQRV